MKKNQGYSLIELVTSLAILAIVGLVLVGFLVIASKTFRSENTEVNIQYESQLTINQLKDLIVDSNRGIAYGLQPVVGSFTVVDMKDLGSEAAILNAMEAADISNINKVKRCLLIYNEVYLAASNSYEYPVCKIVWDPTTKQLKYAQKTFATLVDLEADRYLNSISASDYYLMSDYMELFSVKMMDGITEEISLEMTLLSGGKEYKTSSSISLRNKVVVSDDVRIIYQNNNVIKPSLINGVSITKGGNPITSDNVNVGATIQYVADVEVQAGASVGSEAVMWSISGNSTYGEGVVTSISQSGELTLSPYETASQITVTAKSVVDASKKAVLIIHVENSLGEFGYVNSLALGEAKTGDIAAATAPGGPYVYYGIPFEDNSSYITYVNESKLTSDQKGVTWTVTSDAPTNSFEWGVLPGGSNTYGLSGCPVYVKAYYPAMGYKIYVTATTKANNYSNTKISVTKEFTVNGLQQPITEITPTIALNVDSSSLARNGKIVVTNDIQNVSNMTVYPIEINVLSGFNESVTNKKKSNVYIESTSNPSVSNVFAKTSMDWNTSFTFDVVLRVTGVTNLGNPVDKTITKTITVPRVEVAISSNGQMIPFSTNYKVIPTSVNITNLNTGSAGAIDNSYYPGFSIKNVVYYPDYSYVYWNHTFANSDVLFSNMYGNITLSENLMRTIYYNYIWHKQNVLVFDLQLKTGSNIITKSVGYGFY